MKTYLEWLVEAKTELPVMAADDDRDLIFGVYGAMKQFIPRIGEFGTDQEVTDLPDLSDKYKGHITTNPYLLVVWDNKRKVVARGSNNCAVCKGYDVKSGTCATYQQPLPQSVMFKKDIGGCISMDFLPAFGREHFTSKKFDGLHYAIGKGYIFRYANGRLDPKPLAGPYQVEPEGFGEAVNENWRKALAAGVLGASSLLAGCQGGNCPTPAKQPAPVQQQQARQPAAFDNLDLIGKVKYVLDNVEPIEMWNSKLGHAKFYSYGNGPGAFHVWYGEDGQFYIPYKSRVIHPTQEFMQKLDLDTGTLGRPSGVTDYMRMRRGER